MNTFNIKDKIYSRDNVLIIAELGTGHNGDIVKAKELIDAAASCGADCVKVQIVYADEILHPATGTVPLPAGDLPLYELFKKLEAPKDFYAEIKTYTQSKGLHFLATPFGIKSARELFSLSPEFVKVASPELNYSLLLQELATWNLPVLLSSGVSTLGDIENALNFFADKEKICLLHCVTAYPAPEEDYNLNVLKNLSAIFGVSVGVSDHSLDSVIVPTLSVACGAAVIEKHFCLSREGGGLDDPIALPVRDFALMCASVREAQTIKSEEIISRAKVVYGEEKINSVIGNGIKKLSAAEKDNYQRTNRSIHALIEINAGEIFSEKNIACLRTEKILRTGLPPSFYEKILGRKARHDLPSGEGVRFEDIS